MFTGIISDVGRVRRVTGAGPRRIEVESGYAPETIEIGASIAHDGCCLTVVEKGEAFAGSWHAVEAGAETLAVTTLGRLDAGASVNLERALKMGDELGGHMLTGHVDGLGVLKALREEAGTRLMTFEAPAALARFIAPKGSIAVAGVSLTVNAVSGSRFEVGIIPHTAGATTLAALGVDDEANLEVDLVARYLARLAEARDA